MKKFTLMGVLCGMVLILASLTAQAAPFLYQGQLKVNDAAANDAFDLQFQLFGALTEGVRIGDANYRDDLNLTNGVFNVVLDFGADAFDGTERWLEIAVRAGSSDNSIRTGYQILLPRQRLFATPYAQHSDRATTSTAAENAAKLDNMESSYFARAVHSHAGVYSAVGHSHRTTDITSGAFPDERIDDSITISFKGSVDGAAINQGVVAEKFIDPYIARDAEVKDSIGDHADTANAHHTWPLTDAQVPDDITIDENGNISAKAVKSDFLSNSVIPSGITRDTELAFEAVVAPTGGDYTTIQAALAANNKTILVRNGTYTLDSNITITRSGTVIIGESRNGVIIDCNNAAYGIKAEVGSLYAAGTVSINNGSSTVTGTGTSWSTNLSDVSRAYILLDDVWYKISSIPNNTTITLLYAYKGKSIFDSIYKAGYILKDIRIENLTIANYVSIGNGAISFFGVVDASIKNCAADNCNGYGLKCRSCHNIQILNGLFTYNRSAGIYIEYSNHIYASGNYCLNNIEQGMTFKNSKRCAIFGNHCLNNTLNGIDLDSSNNNNLTNNICSGNARGIRMYVSHYNTINANQCLDNREDGIWLAGNSDRNPIIGNTCMSNSYYGVNIEESSSYYNIVGMNILIDNTFGAGRDGGTDTQQKSTNYPTF